MSFAKVKQLSQQEVNSATEEITDALVDLTMESFKHWDSYPNIKGTLIRKLIRALEREL